MASNVKDNLTLDSETNEFVPRKAASDNFADIIVPKTKANDNFKENNKELLDLIDEKYEKTKDAELREKFDSNDKNVVAAVAIACQRTKATTIKQKLSDKVKTSAVLDAEFAEHYEQALDDINKERIKAKHPETYNSDHALKKLDKKIVKKKKRSKAPKKNNIIKCVEGCQDKNCQLTHLKLYLIPKIADAKEGSLEKKSNEKKAKSTKDNDDSMFIESGERTDSTKINDALNEYEAKKKSKELLIDDTFIPKNDKEEYHIVGGRLEQFQANFRVDVGGKCGHGKPTKCPQVEVSTNKKTLKVLEVLPFTTKFHKLDNNDPALARIRLSPDSPVKGLVNNASTFVLDRISPSEQKRENRATYTVNLTSCKDKPYDDFSPKLIIHPKVILVLSISIKYDLAKGKLVPIISYKRKNDTELSKFSFDGSKNPMKECTRIINELLGGSSMILSSMLFLMELYQRFATLGKTDGTDDTPRLAEQPSNDSDEDKTSEEPTGKDAAFLNPQINLSYKRNTANLPKQHFSEIGHDQTIFISGSPLFKFEKEVEILNFLWRKSLKATRKATKWATLGGSELAIWAIDKLELHEGNEGAFSKCYAFIKCGLAKNHIEAQENQVMLQGGVPEQNEELPEPLTDEKVDEILSKPASKEYARVNCTLKFSGGAETDDPDAGILWEKPAGAKKFTYSETNMYVGLNASASGELTITNQILKTVGFASSVEDSTTEAGLLASLTSADKTGESRAGLTLGYLPQGGKFPKIPERKPFIKEGMSDKKIAKEKARIAALKKQDLEAQEGFYGQWFYSGLNIEIIAYIWFNRSTVSGDEDDPEKEVKATTAEAGRPSGRNTGQVQVKVETTNNTPEGAPDDKPKTKTFIDFCIFKARESTKRKVTKLFTMLPDESDDEKSKTK